MKDLSTSKRTIKALEEKPFLLEALAQGYANVSAAARTLKKETGGSEAAVRAAVKRYKEERLTQKRAEEKKILGLVKDSKLSLDTKICTAIVERTAITEEKTSKNASLFKALFQGPTCMTLVVEEKNWNKTVSLFKPAETIRTHKDLVALTLVSPPNVENVPGVVAFLTAQMARAGINIYEFWSSYSDTVFVLDKKDATKAYETLSALL